MLEIFLEKILYVTCHIPSQINVTKTLRPFQAVIMALIYDLKYCCISQVNRAPILLGGGLLSTGPTPSSFHPLVEMGLPLHIVRTRPALYKKAPS